jgi:hypothetical protein
MEYILGLQTEGGNSIGGDSEDGFGASDVIGTEQEAPTLREVYGLFPQDWGTGTGLYNNQGGFAHPGTIKPGAMDWAWDIIAQDTIDANTSGSSSMGQDPPVGSGTIDGMEPMYYRAFGTPGGRRPGSNYMPYGTGAEISPPKGPGGDPVQYEDGSSGLSRPITHNPMIGDPNPMYPSGFPRNTVGNTVMTRNLPRVGDPVDIDVMGLFMQQAARAEQARAQGQQAPGTALAGLFGGGPVIERPTTPSRYGSGMPPPTAPAPSAVRAAQAIISRFAPAPSRTSSFGAPATRVLNTSTRKLR